MAHKLYDVVVKTGEYQAGDGSMKGRYENIGVMMQGDNGPYLLLKRTFNPAGVVNSDGRDTLLVSLFEPSGQQQQQGNYQQAPQQNSYQQAPQQGSYQQAPQQAPQQNFQQPRR